MAAWKALKKAVRYLTVLAVIVLVAGGGVLYHLWQRSDQLLRQGIDDALARIVPAWNIDFDSCRLSLDSCVSIENVTLLAPGSDSQLATLNELAVTLDRGALAERQEIVVTKLRLLKPTLRLRRDRQGRWNWEDLPPPIRADRPLPEIEIVDGTIETAIASADGGPDAVLTLAHADVGLTPSGEHRFSVQGDTNVVGIGHVSLKGEWLIKAGRFEIAWQVTEGLLDDHLVALATRFYPPLDARLAGLEQQLRRKLAPPSPHSHSILMVANTVPADHAPNSPAPLGITADVQASGHLSRAAKDAPLDFSLRLNVLRGRFNNPWLPFPLHDLSGVAEFAAGELKLKDFTAANGTTRVSLAGRAAEPGAPRPGAFRLNVTNLVLDERLKNRLPEPMKRIYEMHHLTGYVDLAADFHQLPDGAWRPADVLLQARRVSMHHEKFPLAVEGITGTLRADGPWLPGATTMVFENVRGTTGNLPVTISGEIVNPGPSAKAVLDFHTQGLPINDALLAACKPSLRKTLQELGLKGKVDLHAQLRRAAGPAQPFELLMAASLKNATLRYEKFPLLIDNVSCEVAVKPNEWHFEKFQGCHGDALLSGNGSYRKSAETGELHLEIEARKLALDESLKQAVPAHLRRLWEALDISGVLGGTIIVDQKSGREPQIRLPRLELTDGSLRVRSFPVPINEIDATLSYHPPQPGETAPTLKIHGFHGKYNQADIAAEGTARCDRRDWGVRLTDLSVTNLEPDRGFRTALPEGLRGVFGQLDPHQTIDIAGNLLHLRGTDNPQDPVTAGWDLETTFCGGTFFAGLTFERIYGTVATWGTWDGVQTDMAGAIALESVSVLGHKLEKVHGPIRVLGDEMVIGSVDAFAPADDNRPPPRIPDEHRVRASAVDGVITLDARVLLRAEPDYNVRMTMSHGKLEDYARRYLPGTANLAGTMNGWIDLQGRGDAEDSLVGRGQLQISPARLYELPVIAQVLSVPTLSVPSRTAFNYARLDFRVANRRFHFERIDLDGKAIKFVGQGQVGFDEQVALDFYSRLPRTQIPVPFVRDLVGQFTNDWVGVEVRGTIDAPIPRFIAAPKLDDALRMFLQAFEIRRGDPRQQYQAAPRQTPQTSPLSRRTDPTDRRN